MRVLITRPAREAKSLAATLAAEGHSAIVSPLLEIQFADGPAISLGGFQAVLATSANGIHALTRRTAERGKPVFAVGPETAAAATAQGFRSIKQADGDANTLALAVQQWIAAKRGPLLYAAGRDRTGQLETALSNLGFTIHTEVLYAAHALSLNAHAIAALGSGEVDAVMLFSTRSARLFVEQLALHQVQHASGAAAALCISPAVAAVFKPEQFAAIHVAASPNRDSMLALLRELSCARAQD
ncbi:MAG: uroporphyrinogen-III synthase [Alphaproteobacteria bacterium]|nr:uroporphyrinogen-III synthase [Alphaproteobacteria bacterium]